MIIINEAKLYGKNAGELQGFQKPQSIASKSAKKNEINEISAQSKFNKISSDDIYKNIDDKLNSSEQYSDVQLVSDLSSLFDAWAKHS